MGEISLNILYLDRDQVVKLGGEDMELAVADMENLLVLREKGDVRVPPVGFFLVALRYDYGLLRVGRYEKIHRDIEKVGHGLQV